jgi:hypothetical protein
LRTHPHVVARGDVGVGGTGFTRPTLGMSKPSPRSTRETESLQRYTYGQ